MQPCQTDGQLTDTIPDFFVEQFIWTVRVLIGTDDRGIAGLKNFIKNTDIKIKQFFETDKVVFCHLVDASSTFPTISHEVENAFSLFTSRYVR